jgi:hypothetical protein
MTTYELSQPNRERTYCLGTGVLVLGSIPGVETNLRFHHKNFLNLPSRRPRAKLVPLEVPIITAPPSDNQHVHTERITNSTTI